MGGGLYSSSSIGALLGEKKEKHIWLQETVDKLCALAQHHRNLYRRHLMPKPGMQLFPRAWDQKWRESQEIIPDLLADTY